ncbi:MAG TPA: hypothetical protein H9807_01285 [Candidatus Bacteroides merdavium]|uniref:Uncharacterized protein n=1 Tax=Candidatus Bacteroides merdavium TaxID=2838472 RepID=A0A9D2GXF2_9BACE|nr:hypothetical protein [uncultured Bacteroides sp.]HIZ90746.1 hypothetical protein [Candidatus Bacteroides merdavium]
MNLEEMQQAWKELNERVARNEILHREEVKRILNTRKESQLEKLMRLEKTGLLTIVALCLFCIYAWTTFPGYHLPINITAAILLVGSLVLQAGRLRQLTSMKRAENLEMQIRYALRYKAAYNRTYLILYPIIILFAIMLVVNFHTLFNRTLILLLLAVCLIADYFIFHYTHGRVKQMIEANRELKQIEEEKN